MKHLETRMRADGSVVIPDEIKERLKLKEGDRVDFYLERNGRSVRLIARNGRLSDLKGLFKHEGPPINVDDEIMASLAEKHDRINREWAEWHAFQEWRKSRTADAAE
jgi:AbrB family looped-hinge helix DNA binding protein